MSLNMTQFFGIPESNTLEITDEQEEILSNGYSLLRFTLQRDMFSDSLLLSGFSVSILHSTFPPGIVLVEGLQLQSLEPIQYSLSKTGTVIGQLQGYHREIKGRVINRVYKRQKGTKKKFEGNRGPLCLPLLTQVK